MRYLSIFLAAGVLSSSCCNRCDQAMNRYYEDGRAKPVVAIASMIDTSSFEGHWSLSEEFTSLISDQIANKGSIYVTVQDEFPFAENPFSTNDLSWMKREFPQKEFVVFLDLVQHELTSTAKDSKNSDSSHTLDSAVRLRVVDLRPLQPKVVLQELLKDRYFIPKTILPTDYSVAVWGTSQYNRSPMGTAHHQFAQEIANRISDYVLLAKSR